MRVIWWTVALACLAGCGSGIGPHQPQVTPVTSGDPAPRTRPSMVYVTDFDLEFPQGSPSQDTSSMRQGPLAQLRERLQGGDPVTKAHAAVGMLAASITDDLNEDGMHAQRLSAGDPKPTSGWLVRGVVTELDQGDQLRRAMVGFGAGASELQLWVGVTDLARHPDVPFYTLGCERRQWEDAGSDCEAQSLRGRGEVRHVAPRHRARRPVHRRGHRQVDRQRGEAAPAVTRAGYRSSQGRVIQVA